MDKMSRRKQSNPKPLKGVPSDDIQVPLALQRDTLEETNQPKFCNQTIKTVIDSEVNREKGDNYKEMAKTETGSGGEIEMGEPTNNPAPSPSRSSTPPIDLVVTSSSSSTSSNNSSESSHERNKTSLRKQDSESVSKCETIKEQMCPTIPREEDLASRLSRGSAAASTIGNIGNIPTIMSMVGTPLASSLLHGPIYVALSINPLILCPCIYDPELGLVSAHGQNGGGLNNLLNNGPKIATQCASGSAGATDCVTSKRKRARTVSPAARSGGGNGECLQSPQRELSISSPSRDTHHKLHLSPLAADDKDRHSPSHTTNDSICSPPPPSHVTSPQSAAIEIAAQLAAAAAQRSLSQASQLSMAGISARNSFGGASSSSQFFCVACGIKFSSFDNLQAHQTYYCSKRTGMNGGVPIPPPPPPLQLSSPAESSDESGPMSPSMDGHNPFSSGGRGNKMSDVTDDESHERQGPVKTCSSPESKASNQPTKRVSSQNHCGVSAMQCFICKICGYKGHTLRGMRTHVRLHSEIIANDPEEGFIETFFDESRAASSQRSNQKTNTNGASEGTTNGKRRRRSIAVHQQPVPVMSQDVDDVESGDHSIGSPDALAGLQSAAALNLSGLAGLDPNIAIMFHNATSAAAAAAAAGVGWRWRQFSDRSH